MQHENYGYDPYEQPPSRGLTEKIFGARMAQKLKSPAVALAVLLVAGAGFAGIIAGTYGGGEEAEAVPTIRADAGRFRTEPSDRGGMEIAHRDSTVFNTVRNVEPFSGDKPVENLLAAQEESAPADKLAAFEKVAAEEMSEADAEAPDEAGLEPAAGAAKSESEEMISGAPENEAAETMAAAESKEEAKPETESAAVEIVQEIVKIPPQELASGAPATKPETLHKPGASPETLEFVRSVLDKKDTREVAAAAPTQAEATQVAAVAPAAGNATSFRIDPAGTHYVQVSSVTSPEATVAEWEKLQKSITVLSGLDYRVQQADLGERGTYYRIQTGPFTAENAKALCEAIKAQKPDGCLVVR